MAWKDERVRNTGDFKAAGTAWDHTHAAVVGAEPLPPTQLVLSRQQGGGFWKMFTTRDIPCVNPCSNVPTFMQDNLELTFCSTKKGFGKCLRE